MTTIHLLAHVSRLNPATGLPSAGRACFNCFASNQQTERKQGRQQEMLMPLVGQPKCCHDEPPEDLPNPTLNARYKFKAASLKVVAATGQ